MGKKDIRWREPKKAKKDSKKSVLTATTVPASPSVEVIKTKGKKERPPEEE